MNRSSYLAQITRPSETQQKKKKKMQKKKEKENQPNKELCRSG